MKKPTPAQVQLKSIDLIALEFKENNKFKFPKEGLTVVFEVGTKHKVISNSLTCTINEKINIFPKSDDAPFTLNLEIRGIFGVENKKDLDLLKDFCETNGPAIMFPYARSIVSDLTSRTSSPTLNLPLINMSKVNKAKQ